MHRIFYIALFLIIFSCSEHKDAVSWDGELIEREGTYTNLANGLSVDISIEDGFVRYAMYDSLDNQLLKFNENISAYQRWAFIMDEDGSLWVLSSDIGNAVWKKNLDTKKYEFIKMDMYFDKSTIPKSIYNKIKPYVR